MGVQEMPMISLVAVVDNDLLGKSLIVEEWLAGQRADSLLHFSSGH